MRPINPKVLAVKLAESVEIWGVPDNWQKVAQFYREALGDLPEDVALSALKSARIRCKWLPKPSEMRAFADEEMNYRASKLRHARAAAATWRDNLPPEIDPSERKRVGELLGQLAKQLRAGGDPNDLRALSRNSDPQEGR